MTQKNKIQKIIIGNWKMNLRMDEASIYLHKLDNMVRGHYSVETIVAPSIFSLQSLSLQLDRRKFKLAAQNFYWRDMGSYTGEVSIAQLKGIVDYAIVGHSERRHIFGETERDIRAKVQAALRSDIKPILCVGETSLERANNETKDVLFDQILSGLANVTSQEIKNCIIAYEPVWAIGSGDAVKDSDIKKAIKMIRKQIEYLYGKKAANDVKVVYGGSVNPDNALAFLQTDGIDGLMIGESSLNAYQFSNIVETTYDLIKEKNNE